MRSASVAETNNCYDYLGETLWSVILSSLPLDEAIRTSILSKNWRKAWTSIPRIDIDVGNIPPLSSKKQGRRKRRRRKMLRRVEDWIEQVVGVLHSHTGPIQTCCISTQLNPGDSAAAINRWVEILIERLVSELTIENFSPYNLEQNLFQCHTLRTLELHTCSLNLDSNIPLGCCNLKTLKLYHTVVKTHTIQHLISQCSSSLRSLTLCDCYVDGSLLEINALDLRELEIGSFHNNESIIVSINTTHLKIFKLADPRLSNQIEIHAPHLEMLQCSTAYMQCGHFGDFKGYAYRLIEVLRNVSHINTIRLYTLASVCLSADIGRLQSLTFVNLKKLTIGLDLSMRQGLVLLSTLLRTSICLEELKLWSYHNPLRSEDDCLNWNEEEFLPQDFWETQQFSYYSIDNTLERVELRGFKGDAFDSNFAKFLLRNAKKMKDLYLIYWYWSPSNKEKVVASLSEVEKAYKDVKLSLVETRYQDCIPT